MRMILCTNYQFLIQGYMPRDYLAILAGRLETGLRLLIQLPEMLLIGIQMVMVEYMKCWYPDLPFILADIFKELPVYIEKILPV